jgi:hypothetical protein
LLASAKQIAQRTAVAILHQNHRPAVMYSESTSCIRWISARLEGSTSVGRLAEVCGRWWCRRAGRPLGRYTSGAEASHCKSASPKSLSFLQCAATRFGSRFPISPSCIPGGLGVASKSSPSDVLRPNSN